MASVFCPLSLRCLQSVPFTDGSMGASAFGFGPLKEAASLSLALLCCDGFSRGRSSGVFGILLLSTVALAYHA